MSFLRNAFAKSLGSRQTRLANLRQDMDRSPVTEMKEMINRVNGKLFEAPTKLLTQDPSLRLASDYTLTSLDGQQCNLMSQIVSKHPATLLTISCSSFSDPMVESFRTPFLNSSTVSNWALADLRPIPSRIKYALWSPFVRRAARRDIPEHLQHAYFVYRGGRELRSMLGVPNLFGGYVYLLDREGFVRWRAAGQATPQETDSMFACIKQLATV